MTEGKGFVFARELDGKIAVSAFNAGGSPVTVTLPAETLKDLAALLFSSMGVGLGSRDLLRFVRAYRGDLRTSLAS